MRNQRHSDSKFFIQISSVIILPVESKGHIHLLDMLMSLVSTQNVQKEPRANNNLKEEKVTAQDRQENISNTISSTNDL